MNKFWVASPGARSESAAEAPLCVDLDGTLIRTDILVESLLCACRTWAALRLLPRLVWAGKAGLKEGLAAITTLDCSLFPYDPDVIAYLKEQKAAGRRLVLVTASNRHVAAQVARHLGLFDEVIASDDGRNLKGAEKARALVERFGERGFAYVGNERCDLHVWAHAGSAVVVGASAALAREAARCAPVERVFARRSVLWAALREIRPPQWVKNFLVFVPIVTSGAYADWVGWSNGVLAFAAFCATSSGVYLLNDMLDLEADRRHPRKRHRPLASGALPLSTAFILMVCLAAVGALLASAAGILAYVVVYATGSVAYSAKLKERPLVDVFLLAGLYSVRLYAGGVATDHWVSLWLLAFSCFLFLGLAIMKRVTELDDAQRRGDETLSRRGYSTGDMPILYAFGTNACFVSSMILALYVQSDVVLAAGRNPQALWLIVPLMLFWQCRLWLATARGYMTDDPIVYTLKDWVSALVAVGLLITMMLSHVIV